jgi:hypothetical protein
MKRKHLTPLTLFVLELAASATEEIVMVEEPLSNASKKSFT